MGDAAVRFEQRDAQLVRWLFLYEPSRRGRIPTVTLGRYRRYRREAIEGWIKTQEEPTERRGNGDS